MYKHELKYCPRCRAGFECKQGTITECQCFGIQMKTHVEEEIAKKYRDCLCRECLLELNSKPGHE